MAGLLALRDKSIWRLLTTRIMTVTVSSLRQFDESEPLPGGGDQLPVPAPSQWGKDVAVGKTLVSSAMIDLWLMIWAVSW